jgi:O-antigen biosynthesis protein
MVEPFVSCVMPTYNRRAFIPAAIDCWLKQSYKNRELVILDDGEDAIQDLVPDGAEIVYQRSEVRIGTLGEKRNKVNSLASGELICHWDDDDWSASDRIADQVARLLTLKCYITGYSSMLFWDSTTKQAKRYISDVSKYVCGTTLMYYKQLWQGHRFKDQQMESDNAFVWPILSQVAASNDSSHMVARIHRHHTSSKDNIREIVSKTLIPAEFWENEKLIA